MSYFRQFVPSFVFAFAAISLAGVVTLYVEFNVAEHLSLEEELAQLNHELAALQDEVDALRPPLPLARKPSMGRPDPAAVYAIPIGNSPVLGPKDAAITLIEFVDYQCPFCRKSQDTLLQIQQKYADDVKIVFKHHHLPFHRKAKAAARAANCAGKQGSFWQMSEALWQNQRKMNDEMLRKQAVFLQLNSQDFARCLENDDERTASDLLLVDRFSLKGTPAFFINGRFLSGARPFAQFAKLIDEELKKVSASKVDPSKYYEEEVMRSGLKRVRNRFRLRTKKRQPVGTLGSMPSATFSGLRDCCADVAHTRH
ncbi:MAG: DsbA family protein [Deltaproteobacteria bacterium]|nr:DsbA family protein [Deltaproteobacteria bacterium]